MGPARRRFHGVPRYSRGPRGSSNSVQAVGAARSRRFSWRIFFPLSFSITAPISYPSPPFWIFWRKNNIATMTQLYSRKRDKCCDEFFFFLVTIRAYYIDITLYISSILRELSPKEQYIINGDRASWRKLTRNGDCYGRLRETFDRRID